MPNLRLQADGSPAAVSNAPQDSRQIHSKEFAYVITTGRKSSQKHVVKLQYVPLTDDSICVLVNKDNTPDWILNFESNHRADCLIGSRGIFGRIRNIEFASEKKDYFDLFKPENNQSQLSFLSEMEHSQTIVIIYHFFGFRPEIIHSLEFDFQAKTYTANVLGNDISRWMRQVTVGWLLQQFKPGQRVIEIGCGTGIETVELAKRGIEVTATDVSERMLSILRQRARNAHVEQMIKPKLLSSSNLEELAESSPLRYDGACSNFGAVNLEPNLSAFSRSIHRLVRSKSIVSFAVWNRFCFTDALARLAKRDSSITKERFSGQVRAKGNSQYSLDTFAYSPRQFAAFFSKDFETTSTFALPTLIPPYQYYKRLGWLLRLGRADLALGRLRLFRSIGDNFVITMKSR